MNHNHAAYDIIGDIHGHADSLRLLLSDKLGYVENAGVFSHAERKAIFVGDFIDRGPKIRETLEIVHRMVSAGRALAVPGQPRVQRDMLPHQRPARRAVESKQREEPPPA